MNKRPGYSPEVRERAVRLVLRGEHEHSSRWAAIKSVASKIGCTPESLRTWVNKLEVDSGTQPGITSDHAERLKTLEREKGEDPKSILPQFRNDFNPRIAVTVDMIATGTLVSWCA